jgi:membrane-associated protease RseP (regulator of RpoE activity)
MTTLDALPSPDLAGPGAEPRPPAGGLRTVLLVVALAALGSTSVALGFWKPLLVIVALFAMIMLHELGHFVMAKRAGMKATEFFVGFGPRLWSFRRGETEYGVKALPLGGYVKIIGMTNLEPVAAEDEPKAYRQKPFWSRFGVAVAGSAMHMIIAFALLFALNAFVGNDLHKEQLPVISEITAIQGQRSPANEAGFQVGDEITALDGAPVTGWDHIRSYVSRRPGEPIEVQYRRAGQLATTTVTPLDLSTLPASAFSESPADGEGNRAVPSNRGSDARGYVGISPTPRATTVGPVQAVGRSASDLATWTKRTVEGMGQLFSFQGVRTYSDQVRGKDVSDEDQDKRFVSPVGIYRIAGAAADRGIGPVLTLLVLINVFVGLFNMLPLLPFDGGHVSIAVYEAIRSRLKGRRHFADITNLMPVAYVTVFLLAVISISSLYIDIARPLDLS